MVGLTWLEWDSHGDWQSLRRQPADFEFALIADGKPNRTGIESCGGRADGASARVRSRGQESGLWLWIVCLHLPKIRGHQESLLWVFVKLNQIGSFSRVSEFSTPHQSERELAGSDTTFPD